MMKAKSYRDEDASGSCRRYQPWRSILLSVVAFAFSQSSCASVAPRPLTIKEKQIIIVPNSPGKTEVTAILQKECRPSLTLEDVRVVNRLLQWPPSAPCPDFQVRGLDDLRRCAGLYHAQVVEIVSEETEVLRSLGWAANLLAGALGHLGAGMVERIGAYRMAGDARARSDDLLRSANQDLQDPLKRQNAWWREEGSRTVARDLRLWQCPAPDPEPREGELVVRWPEAKSSWAVDVVRDGQVVSRALDGYVGLRDVVASHPLAAEHADRATVLGRSAVVNNNLAVVSGLVFLASTGAAVAGTVIGFLKHWPSYAIGMAAGGGGAMIVSVSLASVFGTSGGNSGRQAATEAVNAVDLYNDEYIYRKDVR